MYTNVQDKINVKEIWDSVLNNIENELSSSSFKMWLVDTFISKIEDGVVVIATPNIFARDWIKNHYHKTIFKLLRESSDQIRSVDYIVANKQKNPSQEPAVEIQVNTSPNTELPIMESVINKEDGLNPRYTFDQFIVGSFNELAHAAAQAIVKQPGILYNPLFIYGNTGHGKTHLIQAIGNSIKNLYKDKKVFYISSEKFTNDVINGINEGKIKQIKEKYRKYDVLIMDDIQFLSNREKTQEELFHLFNFLYENNKQIVFSSDKHPNFIPKIEERLVSRFNQGMIVDLPKPDIESRMSIIKKKLEATNLFLSDNIILYISEQIDSNIRQIEGIINTINCQSQLKKRVLTFNEVKDMLKNAAKPKQNVVVEDIIKIVAEFYNIEIEEIINKSRKKEVVKPRQLAMYLLREIFDVSYPTIGEKMGGRDHSTVMHSYERIKKDLEVDPVLVREIDQIKSMF